MKTKFSKIIVISYTRKTKMLYCQFRIGKSLIFVTDVLRIWMYIMILNLNSIIILIFFFRIQLNYVLGFIRKITFSLSTQDSLLMLYFDLVRSMCEYACVAWKFLTFTDFNDVERIQRH
jgi:hypothetical protein